MGYQQSKASSNQRRRYGIALLFVSTLASGCEAFVASQPSLQNYLVSASSTRIMTAAALPDISDVLNGESSVDPVAKEFIESTEGPLNGETEAVSSFAPALTYDKYLTMQSKRVLVSVKYSEQSNLRPYFLTVAKKIKDAFPDVVLEKILVPKVEASEQNKKEVSTFEVVVDGKIIVRSPSRKGSLVGEQIHVFVNMREIEAAIVRARKRRRPQTVYGEEDVNSRLEFLKSKAMEKVQSD